MAGTSRTKRARRPLPTAAAEKLRAQILEYLQAHNAMTLATCSKNAPWAAAVFYASDGLELYFLSNPKSRHGANMRANERVSAAIHDDPDNWREIRGIQMEGVVEQVRSQQLKSHFWEVYLQKFPFVEEFFEPGALNESLQSRLAGIRLYRLTPDSIWFLDNGRGFGHREELPLK